MQPAPSAHALSHKHLLGLLALLVALECAHAVITIQIGGANRLSSSAGRLRDKYSCHWDCDLVGCQIARDDDECAYECQKICRLRYDYAARSGATSGELATAAAAAQQLDSELKPKSSVVAEPVDAAKLEAEMAADLASAGTSVRLHLPRNASARNFAIWERCSSDGATGRLTEKPFNL